LIHFYKRERESYRKREKRERSRLTDQNPATLDNKLAC